MQLHAAERVAAGRRSPPSGSARHPCRGGARSRHLRESSAGEALGSEPRAARGDQSRRGDPQISDRRPSPGPHIGRTARTGCLNHGDDPVASTLLRGPLPLPPNEAASLRCYGGWAPQSGATQPAAREGPWVVLRAELTWHLPNAAALNILSVMAGGQRWDFDCAIIELGREFERRRMRDHLAALRQFWVRRIAERKCMPTGGWDAGLVVGWLCLMRIPPLDDVYPVLPRDSPCPTCGEAQGRGAPSTYVRVSFPGGWFEECRRCGQCWLHPESAPSPARA